jgi:hypothetical protein
MSRDLSTPARYKIPACAGMTRRLPKTTPGNYEVIPAYEPGSFNGGALQDSRLRGNDSSPAEDHTWKL